MAHLTFKFMISVYILQQNMNPILLQIHSYILHTHFHGNENISTEFIYNAFHLLH